MCPGYSKPAGILSDLGSAGLPSHPGSAPEKVQIQFLDNGLKSCLALHSVSGRVQGRGEGRHGQLAGGYGYQAAAYAGLGRKAGLVHPVPCGIIEAGHAHFRQNWRNVDILHHPLLADGVDASVGIAGAHQRQLGGSDVQGAHAGVQVHDHGRRIVKIAVAVKQPCDAAVVLVGSAFRLVDLLVHGQGRVGEVVEIMNHVGPYFIGVRPVDQADCRHGSGVDQGVEGLAAMQFNRHDGVEGLPGGVCPDLCAELLHSDQIHDVGQVEGLGDGFNGKGGVRGACGQQVSVDSDHGNRQQVGGNLGQSGNVGGVFASLDGFGVGIRVVQSRLYLFIGRDVTHGIWYGLGLM